MKKLSTAVDVLKSFLSVIYVVSFNRQRHHDTSRVELIGNRNLSIKFRVIHFRYQNNEKSYSLTRIEMGRLQIYLRSFYLKKKFTSVHT